MNLRDLKYLVTVADLRHFGKAAQLCNVSQPTLSMQLKKLEELLEVQLFERTNRQVMLTREGSAILAHARRILEESEQIVRLARESRDPFAGDLALGLFPTLAPYLLPLLLPRLRGKFTKLNFLLTEAKTALILDQLQRGELDAALIALPLNAEGIETSALFEEPFMLAVPAAHYLARHENVSYPDLKGETMLLLDDGHCLREQALSVCQAIGIGEARNFRATSLETLRQMVAGGGVVTLMPELAARPAPDIAYIPFAPPQPFRTIGLCWRETSARKPLYKAMAGFIRSLNLL